jgi:hypothetical protein
LQFARRTLQTTPLLPDGNPYVKVQIPCPKKRPQLLHPQRRRAPNKLTLMTMLTTTSMLTSTLILTFRR